MIFLNPDRDTASTLLLWLDQMINNEIVYVSHSRMNWHDQMMSFEITLSDSAVLTSLQNNWSKQTGIKCIQALLELANINGSSKIKEITYGKDCFTQIFRFYTVEKMVTIRMMMIFAGTTWYCDNLFAETYMGRRETGAPPREFIVQRFRINSAPLTYQETI